MPGDREQSHRETIGAPSPAPTISEGEVFANRYEVERLLGRGGMGAVYKAKDREVGEMIALKVLFMGPDNSERAIERFRREVRLARRVTHKNAARTYDLGEFGGIRYLTMEYVEGKSLRNIIDARAPIPAEKVCAIGVQIAEGLKAAHGAGVVHRDLKPANILIEPEGRVVITDFGIARASSGQDVTLDTVGMLGTPAYMAPEQVRGDKVDGRADVYALGLILFEMLTKILPFTCETMIATAVSRLQNPPPDPRDYVEMPDPLARFLLRCLAGEADHRPTEEEIANTLREIGGSDVPDIGPEFAAAASGMHGRLAGTSTPGHGQLSKFAPTSPGERGLAVLPFRYRGPKDEEYLGEALTDELVDVLSMTRGLRVTASGATQRFDGDRDPKTIGTALSVDVVVDGTVQRVGKQVRISARMLEVETAVQLWSERFEGQLEDVFELQDRMGKRIAEALRVELETLVHRGVASQDAIELYFRARRQGRVLEYDGPQGAVGLLEQCLELAPSFKPAMAAQAMTCLRAWFIPGSDPSRNWEADSRAAVGRAMAEASDIAETHLASAVLHVQVGEYRQAAQELAAALKIAPTYAEVQEWLGTLEVEAGRPEEGMRRLRLATELNPVLTVCWVQIARHLALENDMDAYEAALDELKTREAGVTTTMLLLDIRVQSWYGDFERVRRLISEIPDDDSPMRFFLTMFGQALLGEVPDDTLEPMFENIASLAINPRYFSMILQFAAEAMAIRGHPDLAIGYIERATESVLVDLEWMDKCPALKELRARPDFIAARRKVKARAEQIWTR